MDQPKLISDVVGIDHIAYASRDAGAITSAKSFSFSLTVEMN